MTACLWASSASADLVTRSEASATAISHAALASSAAFCATSLAVLCLVHQAIAASSSITSASNSSTSILGTAGPTEAVRPSAATIQRANASSSGICASTPVTLVLSAGSNSQRKTFRAALASGSGMPGVLDMAPFSTIAVTPCGPTSFSLFSACATICEMSLEVMPAARFSICATRSAAALAARSSRIFCSRIMSSRSVSICVAMGAARGSGGWWVSLRAPPGRLIMCSSGAPAPGAPSLKKR